MDSDDLTRKRLEDLKAWADRGGSADRKRRPPREQPVERPGVGATEEDEELLRQVLGELPVHEGVQAGIPIPDVGREPPAKPGRPIPPKHGRPPEKTTSSDSGQRSSKAAPSADSKASASPALDQPDTPAERSSVEQAGSRQEATAWHVIMASTQKGRVDSCWDEDLPDAPAKVMTQWILELLPEFDADRHRDEDVFHVGVDAGTSGLRVATTHELSGHSTLFDFGENLAGGTRFSLPALAAVDDDGMIVFGNDAAGPDWRRRFALFKAGLLYPDQASSLNRRWQSLGLPRAHALEGARGPGVTELLYAATIGRSLTLALPDLVGTPGGRFLTFSVGAPLDGTELRRHRFARAFAAGVLMTGRIDRTMNPDHLIEVFADAWATGRELVPVTDATARIHVRHEAQLLLRSLQTVMTVGRTFAIVDVGATTTEIAVLRKGDDGKIRRWASESLCLGLDLADRMRLQEMGGSGDVLRLRIERMRNGMDEEPVVWELASELRKALWAVVHRAVNKNPDEKSWRELHIAMAGGGSNIKALRQVLSHGPAPHAWVKQRTRHPLTMPEMLTVVGATESAPNETELLELVCVGGAATSPYEDSPYSDAEIRRVVPVYDDAIGEVRRGRKSVWLS